MGMREKLIELLSDGITEFGRLRVIRGTTKITAITLDADGFADHLIANGVTIQKWIPVTERLPEYGQEVIVYSGNVLKPVVYGVHYWNKEFNSWAHITHWMPLPEPPSGERRTDE